MKRLSLILTTVLIAGCVSYGNDNQAYEWIGCHIVTDNPSKNNYAFNTVGKLEVGSKIYFKAVNKDGTIGYFTTARPCMEGE